MKIIGLSTGAHDVSYAVLEDGKVTYHAELERYTREKECSGDAVQFLLDNEDLSGVLYVTNFIGRWRGGIPQRYPESWNKLQTILKETGGEYVEVGHHKAHAANAFFSSELDDSLIVTLDGGGDDDGTGSIQETCSTAWRGTGNKLEHLVTVGYNFNPGVFWSNFTKHVFGLSTGPPMGNQCGTVMGMAALGDPEKYGEDILTDPGFFAGVGSFPYEKYSGIVRESEQQAFNVAAGLQYATEKKLKEFFEVLFTNFGQSENLCLAGGVALNSVMTGKIPEWFPFLKNIYIPPVPYDAGLAIGTAQYLYHHELDFPRVDFEGPFPAYLGGSYDREEVTEAVKDLSWRVSSDEEVVKLLTEKNVISLFGGRSESGRRALGNRSIIADPRHSDMKDIVNERVKHRQWFRPFAPSVLEECVKDWFETEIQSPYMSFVAKFKTNCTEKVPAVVHHDGTGRLQTVSKKSNEWYYGFIKKFYEATGVPMILNTSFNDREPIVETPKNAVDCFLKTNIDYLYFTDYNILVTKKS